jgi:hypothetical protein
MPGVLATSRAVLIGVSAYEDAGFPPIRAARNSLRAMRGLLSDRELCGWPPERITEIANPISAADLAAELADLTENVTGVLLLYYVGHGVLSARGELCLTVTSTRPDRPKISGLAWDTVADVLRDCPARIRLVILDCCFSGRAIEAIGSDTEPGLADIAHVAGVYTLTATTRNLSAHVPPPDQQDAACTSFTGELRDLLRSGISGGPPSLTFGDIYPVLRQRLRAKGLPTPSQRGTDTVHQFPFTANAAFKAGVQENSADQPAPTTPVPGRVDRARAVGLLKDAERIAHQVTGEWKQVAVRTAVARGLAASDPDRAGALIADAQRIAQQSTDEGMRVGMLESVARVLVDSDPDRAVWLAESISDQRTKVIMLARVASMLAVSDPERAAALITGAESAAELINNEADKSLALSSVAGSLAALDPGRAERLARSITNAVRKTEALTWVARALVARNPDRAAALVADAERLAQSIPAEYSEGWNQGMALGAVVEVMKFIDLGRAERLARSITNKTFGPPALMSVAGTLAASDPDRAIRLVNHWIPYEPYKSMALSSVAGPLAASDPDRAERLARSIMNEDQSSALWNVAVALAASDPDRAERLGRSITDAFCKSQALVVIATIWLRDL